MATRPSVDCDKIRHTADALIAKGDNWIPLAEFLLAVTGCTLSPGTRARKTARSKKKAR